jgi:hypothetical protein
MAAHPPVFKSQRRNTTVVVAIWVLGIVAFLELVFASLALAPRLITAVRENQVTHSQTASQLAFPAPTATAVQNSGQQPTAAQLTHALEAESLPPLNGEVTTPDTPLTPAASNAQPKDTSVLGIVSARLEGSDEGSRKLTITIKADPKVPIDVPQVKVQVYFYDTDGSEITPSKAQVTSNWTSPPVDWKNGEMEILEVRYLSDSADSSIHFAGYVVAIYYKGDLQDFRSEPGMLTKQFPLKYFIGSEE